MFIADTAVPSFVATTHRAVNCVKSVLIEFVAEVASNIAVNCSVCGRTAQVSTVCAVCNASSQVSDKFNVSTVVSKVISVVCAPGITDLAYSS